MTGDDTPKQTKREFLQEKLDNFKQFIEENAKNQDQIKAYKKMGLTKLIIMAKAFMIPFKNDMDTMVNKIIERAEIDEEHRDKVQQYLECFIETLESL